MITVRLGAGLLLLILMVMPWAQARPALAASAAEINREANAALTKLYADVPESRALANKARAILVFPRVYKAGFLFGAQYGDGALLRQGKTAGYYNTVAASYGLQAGVQGFGYVMLFMSDSAVAYLDKSGGFEVGVGPSVVVLDAGAAKTLTTSTVQHDIYAFIFEQKGLMAGMGLQGTKITRIEK
jgi:lipid-binding SYLF domain-containing protein